MDRAGLIENVQLYLPFDDVAMHIDTWIELSEAKFRRDIRIREMREQETFVLGSVVLSSVAQTAQEAVSKPVSTISFNQRGSGITNVYITNGDAVNFPTGTLLNIPLNDGSTFAPTVTGTDSLDVINYDILYLGEGFPVTSGGGISMEAGVTILGSTPASPVAPTGGGFNLSDPASTSLPTGFLEIIDLYERGSSGGALEYLPPQKFWSLDISRSGTGQPEFYTMIGDSLVFAPASDATRNYSMNYFKVFDALTATNTTNTLLTLAPDTYLYSVLSDAYRYLADDRGAAESDAKYMASVTALHSADTRARHRPGGRIFADGVTPDGAFRI